MSDDFDIRTVDGRTTLHLDSSRIDECLRAYGDRKIDVLAVNAARGYRDSTIDVLRGRPEIRALELVSPPERAFDVSVATTLPNLRELTVSDAVPLDLGRLPHLQIFRGMWHQDLKLEGAKLRVLSLNGLANRSADLSELPDLPLEELELNDSSVRSLSGLEKFANLVRLEFSHLRAVTEIAPVCGLGRLTFLAFGACPKIRDHDSAGALKQLRILRLNGCGRIPSIRFIDELPLLEEFRFVNSVVEDGDLTPLLRLQRVGFSPAKHYNHSLRSIEDAIARSKAV